jgi:hypothetical protein
MHKDTWPVNVDTHGTQFVSNSCAMAHRVQVDSVLGPIVLNDLKGTLARNFLLLFFIKSTHLVP